MNKSELVAKVSEKTEYSQKVVDEIVKATFESITEALKDGESFSLIGFGTFSRRKDQDSCNKGAKVQGR